MAPAPRTRVPKGEILTDPSRPSERKLSFGADGLDQHADRRKSSIPELAGSPKISTFRVRRRSSGHNGNMDRAAAVSLRSDDPEVKQHLKHLGPSNAATRPKSTRINTVKIKPGIPNTIPENVQRPQDGTTIPPSHAPQGGIGEGLLENAGREASDGVHSLAVGYGTMTPGADRMSLRSGRSNGHLREDEPTSPGSAAADETTKLIVDNRSKSEQRRSSVSTVGSLQSAPSPSHSSPKKRHTARSGSISENVVDLNGVKKIVLETTSSSDSEDKALGGQTNSAQDRKTSSEAEGRTEDKKSGKKKRKKRGKKKKHGESSESQPLLGGNQS